MKYRFDKLIFVVSAITIASEKGQAGAHTVRQGVCDKGTAIKLQIE
jgi:hypothetical protein